MLYVGITNNLKVRVLQHKDKVDPNCFTARYNINKLVYFEQFDYVNDAIAREKEIKSYSRSKKNELIRSKNLYWKEIKL